MLRCVQVLGEQYEQRHYIIANTDSMSAKRVYAIEATRTAALKVDDKNCGHFKVHFIPRSREVRQSYATSIYTTLRSIFACVPLMWNIRPKLVLCNGPGTCVPIVFVAKLIDFFSFWGDGCKVVFIESVCRVKSLSLTGRILYHLRLADTVVVQWAELGDIFTRSVYLGRL